MRAVTCAVCGAKRGEANNWWVLLETDSIKTALIGPFGEVETLQQWGQVTAQFHLCGEGCLYRKLSAVLAPTVTSQVEGTQLVQTSLHQSAADPGLVSANPTVVRREYRPKDPLFLRLTMPAPLRRIFRFGKDTERAAQYPAPRSSDTTKSTNDRLLSSGFREAAAIGETVKITGKIDSLEPLYVNGEITGTLDLPEQRLTVGPKGKIRGAVCTKEIEIFGQIEGKVKADKVVVRKSARLVGDLHTRTLVIEGGAWFEGRISMGSLGKEDNGCGERVLSGVETGSITSMTGIDDYYVSQSAGNDGARRILQIPEHRANDNCPATQASHARNAF
jgi:cytoskeletal protein CcmA (bactofilin family)